MIAFEHPLVLAAALPWFLFWRWFAGVQRRALRWVDSHVSPAFRGPVTVHSRRSLGWHLWLLLLAGLLLIVAGARPTASGEAEVVSEGGRVLFLVDGSASMNADDTEGGATRFEVARTIAFELFQGLEDHHFGIASYSGVATVHLPLIADRQLVEEALRTIEVHNFYQNSGSSLTGALDAVLRFASEDSPDLQAVLLSDGELPFDEDFGDALAAVASRGIRVHTVAVGSEEGQTRLIFDFRDVVAGKEEKKVLAEYTTRRVDRHLQRIAEETGGRFAVAGAGTAAEVLAALRVPSERRPRVADESARTDLSRVPLAAFLVCFLADALLIGFRRRPAYAFDLGRIGGGPRPEPKTRNAGKKAAATIVLLLVSACDAGSWRVPLWRAHLENERGITDDRLRRPDAARPHYERSIGYRSRQEVPTYNLARSVTLAGDYSEAHDLYQQALLLEPDMVEAYYNNGVALFLWGEAERDPRGCELDRTFDLWHKALRRFETAAERTAETSDLGLRSRSNREFLASELEAMEDLLANPPPECFEPPPPSPDAGGGESQDPPPPPEGSGEPPPEPPPPPPGEPPPGEPPPGGGDDPGQPPPSGPPPLTGDELEEIRQALGRIAEQSQEEGKFFRRTGAEQFSKESWENPEAEVWW